MFAKIACYVAHKVGHPLSFALACLSCVLWAVSGPYFGYSDTWQLVINTGTTVLTFLMLFLLQNTQNRDGAAMQAKLDELIRAVSDARNEYRGIEVKTEKEIEQLKKDGNSNESNDNPQQGVSRVRRDRDRVPQVSPHRWW